MDTGDTAFLAVVAVGALVVVAFAAYGAMSAIGVFDGAADDGAGAGPGLMVTDETPASTATPTNETGGGNRTAAGNETVAGVAEPRTDGQFESRGGADDRIDAVRAVGHRDGR